MVRILSTFIRCYRQFVLCQILKCEITGNCRVMMQSAVLFRLGTFICLSLCLSVSLSLSLSLFLHFNGHFSRGPGLATTRMSTFCILLEQRMMEVVLIAGAICIAPVESTPPTNRHPGFYRPAAPSCCPTNSVGALRGKTVHL